MVCAAVSCDLFSSNFRHGCAKPAFAMKSSRPSAYRLRYETCGRPSCRQCDGHLLAHGPRWQEAVADGGVRRWRVIGLVAKRPAGVTAQQELFLRQEAERDRERRQTARKARRARAAGRAGRSPSAGPTAGSAPSALRTDLAQLGLNAVADAATVKRAYRQMSMRHHPDRPGGSHEAMQALNQAYRRISTWMANE
jgi:hypothetical protein